MILLAPIRLFVLPTTSSEIGPLTSLPAKEESVLPRAKLVLAPKVLFLNALRLHSTQTQQKQQQQLDASFWSPKGSLEEVRAC